MIISDADRWSYRKVMKNYTIRMTSTNGRITLRYAVRVMPLLIADQRNIFVTLAGA